MLAWIKQHCFARNFNWIINNEVIKSIDKYLSTRACEFTELGLVLSE